MRWFIIVVIIILFVAPSVLADRPEYSFPADVFKELEPFPNDFFKIRDLFATQSITAKHLGTAYYQPELIPGWDYWSTRVYTPGSDTFGSYGVFIYPSYFTVHNIQVGDSFNISAFIHTSWGVQKYQGVKLNYSCSQGIHISMIEPDNNNILLYPTAPYFYTGWIQLIELKISVTELNDYTIKIYEETPDDEYELLWNLQYDNYTSGSSIISQRVPKCTIDLFHVPLDPDESQILPNDPNLPLFIIPLFILIVISLLCIMVIYAKRKSRKRTQQEKS